MLRGNKKTSQQCMQTTPVGFEPTRGDPIGLAGQRLNRSANVSSGRRVWVHAIISYGTPAAPGRYKGGGCRHLANVPRNTAQTCVVQPFNSYHTFSAFWL